MAESTREKLVHAAYELFMSNGINAVGLDQIIKRVGVTKSTFYNHFESKDDLVLAVLKWRDSLWPTELRAALLRKAGPRPRNQLLALFGMLDEAWGTKGYTGCVFIYASSEFPHPHDPIHLVAKAQRPDRTVGDPGTCRLRRGKRSEGTRQRAGTAGRRHVRHQPDGRTAQGGTGRTTHGKSHHQRPPGQNRASAGKNA